MCVCMYVAFILGIDFGKKNSEERRKQRGRGEAKLKAFCIAN